MFITERRYLHTPPSLRDLTNEQDAREAEEDVAVKQRRLNEGRQKIEDNKVRPVGLGLGVYLTIRPKSPSTKLRSKS